MHVSQIALESSHCGQFGLESANELVAPSRHASKLGWLRTNHLDQLWHLSSADGGKLVQGLETPKDHLLVGLALKELKDGHGQLGADVVKDLTREVA